MFQFVIEDIATGKMEWLGSYSSRKEAMSFAPAIINTALVKGGVPIDDRDEAIGDFMECGGRVAVVDGHRQIFITKKVFDVWGHKVASPSGSIRVGGKCKWKDPDGGNILDITVDSIIGLEIVCGHTDDGTEVEAPYTELKAA